MNTEFQIRKNGFAEIKKAIIIKTIPIGVLAAGTGIAISHFKTDGESSDVNVLPFVIPIIIGALAFGLLKGIKRQKELFESYKLIIDENEITREQLNTPRISIPKTEIKSITKNPKGVLTIVGNSKTKIIGIPSQIENPENLEQLLLKILPIKYSDEKILTEKYIGLIVLLILGLMTSVYISKNKLIVGITGTILILFLGYSLYEIRRNKNIDRKTKNGAFFIVIVLFSILGTMYFKLTGKI